jgi:hypothetical protein
VRDLLVIIPSRGRPDQFAEVCGLIAKTARAQTDVFLCLDDDDPARPGYLAMAPLEQPTVLAQTGPRLSMAAWTNKIAMAQAGNYRALASIGDDHYPRTDGWDGQLLAALDEHGPGIAYPDDCNPRNYTTGPMVTAPVISSGIVTALGWMCHPGMSHYYCVVPETLVLTADLRWVPIGKLSVGDEVVGVDEWPLKARASRAYRRATVDAIQRRVAECVTVDLEDGRAVTSSTDHRWLAKRRWKGKGQIGPGIYEWRAADQLRPGDLLASPLRTWGEETAFEAGWLSGIFDGEGTLGRYAVRPGSPHFNTPLSVAQNPGAVLDRIEAGLGAMGIDYIREQRHAGRDECVRLKISSRAHSMELLGRLRPARLRAEVLWEGAPAQPRHATFGVVRQVNPVGPAEVVSMKTSTGTFLADGLVAHNCDNVWEDLGRDAGCLYWLPDVKIEHRHPSVTGQAPDATYGDAMAAWDSDQAAFYAWREGQRAADSATVKRVHDGAA